VTTEKHATKCRHRVTPTPDGKQQKQQLASAIAQLFASAAECVNPIICAKQIEAGTSVRKAKERKREKAREARMRKKAALHIAFAIVAHNPAWNVDAKYQKFLDRLLTMMFGDSEKSDGPVDAAGIPIRIAMETIKAEAGEDAPVFRIAMRLIIAERNDQVTEPKIVKDKRCTTKLVQVGPEQSREKLEALKELLRSSNNRLEKKPDGSEKLANGYVVAFEEAVLDWFERVRCLYPSLAQEVQRMAYEYVRLGDAKIAKDFFKMLLEIEILPDPIICDLFKSKITWREVSDD
jgi:hypothetical protein